MNPDKTAIDKIKEGLQTNGFQIEEIKNGIRIDLEKIGFSGKITDFYTLINKPDEIRARLISKGEPLDDQILAKIHSKLQSGVMGAVKIDKFNYLGCRDGFQTYYAHLLEKKNTDTTELRQNMAREALAQLKGVDSKAFRLGLDQLNLPRSSIVRLALTRIFRDSIDTKELLITIEQEASKIINTNELELLRNLKKDQVPFLLNIIHLLWEAVAKKYMDRAKNMLET